MLLKKEYDTDEDEDENDSSTGDSDTDEDQVLDPASEAFKRLPVAVKNQLQKLSGQIESLYDENKKLKEVCDCHGNFCRFVLHARHVYE